MDSYKPKLHSPNHCQCISQIQNFIKICAIVLKVKYVSRLKDGQYQSGMHSIHANIRHQSFIAKVSSYLHQSLGQVVGLHVMWEP
jgi:hypothetical protein